MRISREVKTEMVSSQARSGDKQGPGSVECSIALRGVAPFLLFTIIGFFLGAGNLQYWVQGKYICKNIPGLCTGVQSVATR